jgi:hypothetical protein
MRGTAFCRCPERTDDSWHNWYGAPNKRSPIHQKIIKAKNLLLVLLPVVWLFVPAVFACDNCDDESSSCLKSDRWPVKTFSDLDAASVNRSPVEYTILGLHAMLRPASVDGDGRDPNHRVFPEFTTFRVNNANLKWAVLRDDEDLHMAIVDPADATKTMVIEAPAPDCVPADMAQTMLDIRNKVEQLTGVLTPGITKYLNPPSPVIVTGIPYWDTNHSQADQAPNYLELHPVMDLLFPVPCERPTTRTVNVCLPTANSTVPSPVRIVAAAGGTSVTSMTVSIDGTRVYSTTDNHLDITQPVQPAGQHRVTVNAKDSSGYFWKTV